MDTPLVVTIVLLLITLIAFAGGLIPYPLGLLVLSVFLIARLIHLTDR